MPRLEPALLPVVTALERGLRVLGVPFAVVCALVPELLLDARSARLTNDADVTVTVETVLDDGPTLPVVPLPLYALLKPVAFSDRRAAKDLAGVFHCLQHYLDDDERRYGAEHEGAGVPFEYTGAYLLGADGRPFLDKSVIRTVRAVLDRFTDPDAEPVGMVVHQRGRIAIEDHERIEVFEHFQWCRRGLACD
ncbi:MAG: hypothetical protein IT182_09905 [Acidobacteria bacterium]|nr:hypothetical protein [Acidobacteriota bacterium]